MSVSAAIRPGSVVSWWDGRKASFAVVAEGDGERVRLVLARGAEARVSTSRIAVEIEPPGVAPGRGPDQLRAAGRRVELAAARVRERATAIDVALLWEIVAEAAASAAPGLDELAELALGSRDGEAQAAVLVAIDGDGLHFERHGNAFAPRPGDQVEDLRRQRAVTARREAERVTFFALLRALAAGGPASAASGSETERRYLEALEQLAVHDDGAPEAARALALAALVESGIAYDRPSEGAFRVLRRLGRYGSDDENLQLARCGLSAEFPDEVVAAARGAAARGFDFAGREDLQGLVALSIDSPTTREIDDLLSIEEHADGGFTLGVHIADPAAFVRAGDLVDREALNRGLTWYLTERKVLMLPAPISEEAGSLFPGEARPGLSFVVRLDAAGGIVDYRVERSVLRSSARLDYAAADAALAGGEGEFASALAALGRVATARERARAAAGAILLYPQEISVSLGPDGRPSLERLPTDAPSRRAVAEAMVLAGEVAARFLGDAGVATIFRRQAPPADGLKPPAEPVRDPVRVRAIRRALRRAEVGLEPGPHAGLGLRAYVQVSSPLRRFQDLAGHRQILAALGQGQPYTKVEMQRIAALTERAEADARRAERATTDYWLLRWLEARGADEHAGVIVETEPRPVVQLEQTLLEVVAPALAGAALGERVRVRIERVNPRAGLLVVRGA